jgi:hypothetical protein
MVTGHETATAVTAGTTNPDAKWIFQNNQFSTQGQLAAFVGGNAGVPPFFLGSSLSNAVITGPVNGGVDELGVGNSIVS